MSLAPFNLDLLNGSFVFLYIPLRRQSYVAFYHNLSDFAHANDINIFGDATTPTVQNPWEMSCRYKVFEWNTFF